MLHTSLGQREECQVKPEKTPREPTEDLISLLVSDWRPTPRQSLWAIRIAIILCLLLAIGYAYGVTVWDWLKLLIVPAVIAAGGLWFNAQQRDREQNLAHEHAQDEALQAYLDQMSQLLTDEKRPLHRAQTGDSLSMVARARTLAVLSRLGSDRKRSVLQFLYESGLINKGHPVVKLSGVSILSSITGAADLSGVDLAFAYMGDADLSGTLITRANLTFCQLPDTDLREADLSGSKLTNAGLSGADLRLSVLAETKFDGAILDGATLEGVHLWCNDFTGAVLSNAHLRGADFAGSISGPLYSEDPDADFGDAVLTEADLSEADLTDAIITEEQLAQCGSLEGATMPDGQTLRGDTNPDGPTFEEWLKSREEDNSSS
jgi:uncharacterized protein YjbI with pentapeptide repeats